MLKIYIQIFGTIALVAIIVINYKFFYQTPLKEAIEVKQAETQKLNEQIKVMDGIIAYSNLIDPVSDAIERDRRTIELEIPTTYVEPERTARIYNLILACDLNYRGIGTQAVMAARPKATMGDFIPPLPNKDIQGFQNAVKAYIDTMKEVTPAVLEGANPIDRWQFYNSMAKGWKPKDGAPLGPGFERHRYKLQLTGTYTNIKKFLWMVANDRPMLQATSVKISPKPGVGEGRQFTLDVTIIDYADRNVVFDQLLAIEKALKENPVEFLKQAGAAGGGGGDPAAAANPPAADAAAAPKK